MYDLEFKALLRIASGSKRYDYSPEEMADIGMTIDAIQHLNERLKKLDKKERIAMPTHGDTKKVWRVESASIRDLQVYIDHNTVYLEKRCGAIAPIKPRAVGGASNLRGISGEELDFIARFV